MGYRLLCSFVFAFFSLSSLTADELANWIDEQNDLAFVQMARNISPKGTLRGVVVASPSQKEPDYYYHWVRDAAITMDVVRVRYTTTSSPTEKEELEQMLFDFVDFSLLNQATGNLSGGAGEPKFHVDGTAFNGPWGRPQDDGPALRALTLTRFAKSLLSQGKAGLVADKLYNGHADSVIKHDLEYVARNWRNTSFDVWEEVRGHQFFTSVAQRRALLEGATLAEKMGDHGAAGWYRVQAKEMDGLLARYWDSGRQLIRPTLDRDDGISYKNSDLDSAVVLGVLLGAGEEGPFSITDDRVLATVNKLEGAFLSLYPINHNGEPGIAIGRYPEDRYDGYSTQGQGNPWIINTATLGEYYHRLAWCYYKAGRIRITALNEPLFKSLGFFEAKRGITFVRGRNPGFEKMLSLLVQKADTFLYRVKYHAEAGGRLSEQINRHSGFMQGARDLTWSYGALLSAIEYRKRSAFLGSNN